MALKYIQLVTLNIKLRGVLSVEGIPLKPRLYKKEEGGIQLSSSPKKLWFVTEQTDLRVKVTYRRV